MAFAVLAVTLDSYDSVFVVSFAFAVVGLAVLVLFVPSRSRDARRDDVAPPPRAKPEQ